jgi:hypothetical protein
VREIRKFCTSVPILLVGLKIDMRNDPKTIAERGKFGQHLVTTAEVRNSIFTRNRLLMCDRVSHSRRRLVPSNISNALPRPMKDFTKSSKRLPVRRSAAQTKIRKQEVSDVCDFSHDKTPVCLIFWMIYRLLLARTSNHGLAVSCGRPWSPVLCGYNFS